MVSKIYLCKFVCCRNIVKKKCCQSSNVSFYTSVILWIWLFYNDDPVLYMFPLKLSAVIGGKAGVSWTSGSEDFPLTLLSCMLSITKGLSRLWGINWKKKFHQRSWWVSVCWVCGLEVSKYLLSNECNPGRNDLQSSFSYRYMSLL